MKKSTRGSKKVALKPLAEESEEAYQRRVAAKLEKMLEPSRARGLTAARALLEAESLNSVATLMHARDHAVDQKTRASIALEMLKLVVPRPDVNINVGDKNDEFLRRLEAEMAKERG